MSAAAAPPIRLVGGEVVLADATRVTDVGVARGRIVDLGPGPSTPDERVIDVTGLRVAPGFVDLQVNGGIGIDLVREPERMDELGADLATHGVTSWLPTIITAPPDRVQAALAALAAAPAEPAGARPLGLHLEGPMLNPARVGAHPPELVRPPALDVAEGWSAATGVALVTLAPELPGALDVVAALRDRGVVVALGHSEAGPAEVAAACAAGATLVTHLFNAMSPLHHRAPGLVGSALSRVDLRAGLVVDGLHVDPLVVELAWRLLGPDRLVLVSDAASARGLADDGGVWLPDGTLAGSDLTLDGAVRNLVAWTGGDWAEAVRAASTVPARAIEVTERGELAAGGMADLVVLDGELGVVLTMVEGRVVHDPRGLVGAPGEPRS